MATGNGPGAADDRQPEGGLDLGLAIDGLLGRLPSELVEAVRLGAVPHRFDAELLSLLRGSAVDTDLLLERMRRLGLLGETASGWLTYPDTLRSHLLAELQSRPATYREASARAADYFQARRARPGNPNPDSDLLEHLYHELAADKTTGLIQLRHYFDGFRQAGQFGLAERLLDYAIEQEAVLGQAGRDWLRYLGAQLRQAGPELEASQQTFGALATEAGDPLLRAAARRSLGETLAQSRQWARSIEEIQAALRAFQQIADPFEIANTQASLGLVFVSLAEAAGGLRDEDRPPQSPAEQWSHYVSHAPFLAYRWFSRRFSIMPNFYFGTDYQNWIIVRYLYGAIRWLTQADRTLRRAPAHDEAARSLARTYIGIRLADLRHRIGRWSQAERDFAALAQDPNVRGKPYLRGLVQLGQGRALLVRGRLLPALDKLRECEAIFRQYGDLNDAGKAARLIGQAHARRGELGEACHTYQAAAEAFYGTDDLLNATEALVSAQTLAEQLPTGEAGRVGAAELSERLPRQAYMERFPDRTSGSLHRFFSGFSTFLMMPLTGLLVILLVLVPLLWEGVVEVVLKTGAVELLLAATLILLLLPLLVAWAYEAIYASAGILVARFLPLRWITRQQPVYVVLDQQSLGQYDQQGKLVDLIRWPEVTIVASLDRCVWRGPLTLFSRFLVGDQDKPVVVEGILNHYTPFKREVNRRLRTQPRPPRILSLDFSLFNRRWFLATLAVTVLIVAISFILAPGQLGWLGVSPGGTEFTLAGTDVLFRLWQMFTCVGPLFMLIGWLRNRRAIRRSLGDRVSTGQDWPIWLLLLGVLAVTVMQSRMLLLS